MILFRYFRLAEKREVEGEGESGGFLGQNWRISLVPEGTINHGDDLLHVDLLGRREKLILEMLEEHPLIEFQSLLAQHVQRSCVPQLRGLLQQVPGHVLVGLHAETVAVHVAQVDHRVAVLGLVRTQEVLVGLLVAALDSPGNAVEVDRAQVHHGVRVAHLRGLEVAPHGQLPVLLDPVAAEVAIADLVLGGSVVALGGLDEVGNGLLGGLLDAEAMLVEDAEIEERLPAIALHDLGGGGGDALLVNGEAADHALEPVDGEVVVVLVLLLHDRGLVHQLVGELNLALVVPLYAALVEQLQRQLRVPLPQQPLRVDQAQVVVRLAEALLLRFREESDDGLVELVRARLGLGFPFFFGQFGVEEQNSEVITGPGEVQALCLGVKRLGLLLVPLHSEQLLRITLEVAELVDLPQLRHRLRTLRSDLVQQLVPLLDVLLVLPAAGELAVDEAEREAVARVGLLPGHALLVVPHGFLEIHGQQGALLVDLPQEGAGLRVAVVRLLVVDVEPLHDVLLPVDAEEELVGFVERVRFGAGVADHLLDDLLVDRLLHLDHLRLRPLLLQQLGDKLVVALRELGTHEGLDPVLRLEESEHLPLAGHDLEVVHRRLELLGAIRAAAEKLGLAYGDQVLANGDETGLGVLDELADLGTNFEVEWFFAEDGPHVLEAVLDGHLVLAVVGRGSLLVLLHVGHQHGQVFVQRGQSPQEVLLRLVHLRPRLRPLLLRPLVVPLLLYLVDAPDARDDLVVDRLRSHSPNFLQRLNIIGTESCRDKGSTKCFKH